MPDDLRVIGDADIPACNFACGLTGFDRDVPALAGATLSRMSQTGTRARPPTSPRLVERTDTGA